jgi:uncharacterized protein (TIGR02145 family)
MNFFTQQGRVILLVVLVVVGAVCVAYADHPKALVGQWVRVSDEVSLELFSDGTGIFKTGIFGNDNITWKTEGKRFVMTVYPKFSDLQTVVGDYSLSGYILTIAFDNSPTIFVKKENLTEYKNKKKKEAEQQIEKNTSYFTDSRNGQKYRTVKIGGKTWMAENLNYKTGNSWCYGGDNSNCEKYGSLYDWNSAKMACPAGWRLSSREEWQTLDDFAGGKALKSTNGWYNNGNGTDDYGFSALPGGFRRAGGDFDDAGKYGYWWTATEDNISAYLRGMGYDRNSVNEFKYGKGFGFYVRCVAD